MKIEKRWRAAVETLQLQTERLQATADGLSPFLPEKCFSSSTIEPVSPLQRHLTAFTDYKLALNHLQALLQYPGRSFSDYDGPSDSGFPYGGRDGR